LIYTGKELNYMVGIIYRAYCESEDKSYIGQTTKKLSKREHKHYYDSRTKRTKSYFHRALNKYKFEFHILEKIERSDKDELFDTLNNREIFWIKKFKSNIKVYGYNMDIGGRRSINCSRKPFRHTEETKKKISNSVSGKNNPMYGKSIYDRWVELYGVDVADIKYESYCKKHKSVHGGSKNGMYGKKQSEETKKKIGEKAKKRVGKNASRYVSVDEGMLRELIEVGKSISEISCILNISEYVTRKRVKEFGIF
jgi:group I intron endonuclease